MWLLKKWEIMIKNFSATLALNLSYRLISTKGIKDHMLKITDATQVIKDRETVVVFLKKGSSQRHLSHLRTLERNLCGSEERTSTQCMCTVS